ncbi:MAG: B12-binding domain-containing radical SAM protein, partial [Desulfohalobiaceae bacterium]|nr:B12-binding domain-containing radical SAM protein [Desulfohalobiaceae bacterium]
MPRTQIRPKWPEITWISTEPHSASASPDNAPRVLGINPWVYDFAAYNLWSRPLGLISTLQALARSGCEVALLDCMDRTWRDMDWPARERYGCGRYPRTEIPPPDGLRHIPRRFCRYGLPYEAVSEALARLDPPPDLVLITSIM